MLVYNLFPQHHFMASPHTLFTYPRYSYDNSRQNLLHKVSDSFCILFYIKLAFCSAMDASLPISNQELVSDLNIDLSVEESETLLQALSDPTQQEWEINKFGAPVSPPTDFLNLQPTPGSRPVSPLRGSEFENIQPISPLRGNEFEPNNSHPSSRKHSDAQISPRNVSCVAQSTNQDTVYGEELVDRDAINYFLGEDVLNLPEYPEPSYNSFDVNSFDSLTPSQDKVQPKAAVPSSRQSIHELSNLADSVETSYADGIDPRLLQNSGVVQSSYVEFQANSSPYGIQAGLSDELFSGMFNFGLQSQTDISTQAYPNKLSYAPHSPEGPLQEQYQASIGPYYATRGRDSGYPIPVQPQATLQKPTLYEPQRIERANRTRPLPRPIRQYTRQDSPSPSPSSRGRLKRVPGRYSPRLKTMRDKEKEWIKSGPTTGANKRAKNIATYDPTKHYIPLPEPPTSWGNFSYTEHGELEENRSYSLQEMYEYLYQRPQDRPLTLWIQKVPSDSARRYPTQFSNHCRFQDCPGHRNTIAIGQYRVTFDEHEGRRRHDPFHNAGYVHLYCLEKFFDFPSLCISHEVVTDTRELRHEPNGVNKMTMGSVYEKEASDNFIEICRATRQAPEGYPNYQTPNRPYEGTLLYLITMEKLRHEWARNQKQRAARGTKPSMISEHKNNLEVQTKERAVTRDVRNQVWTSKEQWGGNKRRRNADTDEDTDEEELLRNTAPRAKRQPTTRRTTRATQTTSRKRNYDELTDDEFDSDTVEVASSRALPSQRTSRSSRSHPAPQPKSSHDSKRRRYANEDQDEDDDASAASPSPARVTRSTSQRVTRGRTQTRTRAAKYAGQDETDGEEDESEYLG